MSTFVFQKFDPPPNLRSPVKNLKTSMGFNKDYLYRIHSNNLDINTPAEGFTMNLCGEHVRRIDRFCKWLDCKMLFNTCESRREFTQEKVGQVLRDGRCGISPLFCKYLWNDSKWRLHADTLRPVTNNLMTEERSRSYDFLRRFKAQRIVHFMVAFSTAQ